MTRPTTPTTAQQSRDLRLAILADDAALTASRRLAKLVTGGADLKDPAVVAIAAELRAHIERLTDPRRAHG